MNEFELIEHLTRDLPRHPSTLVGAGDDCAVLDLGDPGRVVLFKTDAVVEGIHFEPTAEPARVGHKALGRCLSDIAAMAGTPTHALVTLALPPGFDIRRIEQLYAGMNALASRHAVGIVGGETTANPGPLLVSVAMLGFAARGRCPLRSAAQAGDAIFVTGELGGSRSGKHLDFEPRLAEARWLVEHFPIRAMIDLSDGLAGDLRHVLKASGVGAVLRADAIPISRAARRLARASSAARPALTAALCDGEDFELLFTLAGRQAVPVLDAWKPVFPGLKLTCVGQVTPTPGLVLRDTRGSRPLPLDGYDHFQQS
jgi:thiamine-monophosphate kinase